METNKRGRPRGEPTENARLTPDQVAKLKAIAEDWGDEWTVRKVLQRLAGKSIDRAYEKIGRSEEVELGESGA